MFEYATHYNGEYTQVYPLEECFRAIACRDADKSKRIEYLEQQVKELKDEHYKDKRLQELTEELNKVRADARRGFPISTKEDEAISAWKAKHDTEKHNNPNQYHGCSGGGYTYKFYPTAIGTFGECICGACHRKAFKEAAGDVDKYSELMKSWNAFINFDDV